MRTFKRLLGMLAIGGATTIAALGAVSPQAGADVAPGVVAPMTKVAFRAVVSPTPTPTYQGSSGTWTIVSKDFCAAAEDDDAATGGEAVGPWCDLDLTNGTFSQLTCSTGTLSGTMTIMLSNFTPHSVTFDFTVTMAGSGGALFGPGGPNVPNANDSAGVQPGPNALVYGTAVLSTAPAAPNSGATGPCGPAPIAVADQDFVWTLDAQLVIESDPWASPGPHGDPAFLAGLAPDDALTDPETTPDLEAIAAETATVGIDPDTGVFVQPPILNDPEGGSGRTCARAARHTGPAAASTSVQVVYAVPTDVTAQWYDKPIVCSDGYRVESTIGYAIMNDRNWMAGQKSATAAKIDGKAYKRLKRTDTAYGRTFTFTDVRFFRLPHSQAYYNVDARTEWTRIAQDLASGGFGSAKYVVFADVVGKNGTGGITEVDGQFAVANRRIAPPTGAVVAVKWGCATEGDTFAEHELTHLFGAVVPKTSVNYDTKHPSHVSNTSDLMYYAPPTTFSGKRTNGSVAPPTYWNAGVEDLYTTTVLGHGSYIETNPTTTLRVC